MEKRELLYSVGRNVNWGTEDSMEVSQKTGNRTYHMTQQFHSWIYIQKKKNKENTNLKRYMHPNAHSNPTSNSQDLEATQVWWTYKEDVAHI